MGSDSKDQLVRAEALMTFARSKEGHPRNNQGNLKRALFSAKKKRRLTRVNADHVPAYAKPFLLPVLREAKLTPRHFSQYPAVRTIDQFRQPKNRTTTPDATLAFECFNPCIWAQAYKLQQYYRGLIPRQTML